MSVMEARFRDAQVRPAVDWRVFVLLAAGILAMLALWIASYLTGSVRPRLN